METSPLYSLSRANERGVALIMVLGMVAIIAAWATTAAYEDTIAINRASNQQDDVRAMMASESALALTQYYLGEDSKFSDSDDLEEEWAMPLPPFPIDEGLISLEITDANRFYNLNDLVNNAGAVQTPEFQQLQQLFVLLDLQPGLVNALVDWMDADNFPYGASGAEDAAYYNKDYHCKNTRLDSLSELRLIAGFDRQIIKLLSQHVIVRPSNGKTYININTASEEIFMALFPSMQQGDAQALIESRPYTASEIPTSTSVTWATSDQLSRLRVVSDAFKVRTHAIFGKASLREDFLLSRIGNTVSLLSRERADWQF